MTAHTALPPPLIWDADHRTFRHLGEGEQCRLHLRGIDVETAGDDRVLRTVDDVYVAVGIQVPDVAGVVPAVTRRLNERQARLCQEWIANRRRLRKTLAEIERLSQRAADLLLKDAEPRDS